MEDSLAAARIAGARALVVGVGGIGSPAAIALAAAGVGTLGLIDPDAVEPSNLHRQPLYTSDDVGRPKVEVAAARLGERFPSTRVEAFCTRFGAGDTALARGFGVLLDGTDSIAAKFVVNEVAVAAGVPLVHAGVLGLRAQLLTVLPRETACYRCVFEEAPPPGELPSCEEAGILGPTAALAGALQASEALRIVGGACPAWANRLLAIDLLVGRWRTVHLAPNPRCPACAGAHATGRREAS